MIRCCAAIVLLALAGQVAAVELATLAATAPDQLLASAPLGDRTVAVTADAIRLVD